MKFAVVSSQDHTARGQRSGATRLTSLGTAALICWAVLTAGCTTTGFKPLFGPKPTQPVSQETQPAALQGAASAPATQAERAQATASEPADPTQRLAMEVQQYVSNLPMDDLQAKLGRPEGQSTSSAPSEPPAVTVVEPPVPAVKSVESPAPTAKAVESPAPRIAEPVRPAPVGQQAPMQPEIVAPAPKPATPKPGEPARDTRIVDIEISPAVLASASPKPAAAQQPNQPASIKTNDASSAGELKDLLDQLRKESASRPDSLGAALRLRLAEWSLTGGAQPVADWPLQDAEKRRLAESVWQVLQVVSKSDGLPQRASSEEFEKALESLRDTLRQVQPLKIPHAALCWSVQNFANYEPLPTPWKFPAGQSSMVVLYCELAGFRSEACPEKPGWYRTLLGERLAILTSEGRELWSYEEPSIEDLCHRPRLDFFVTKKLRIPGNLPTGPYVLKVTIRDQVANRITESNVPFEIEGAAVR